MTFVQFLYRFYTRIKNPTCTIRSASLSRNVRLEQHVTLEYGSHIQADLIGKYTYINKYCLIEKNTRIGRFCSIAYGAKIGLGAHPTDWVSTHPFAYDSKYRFIENNIQFDTVGSKQTTIGHDVWIGANAIILKGVTIGNGAIIGANSLVTRDVEPYSIHIGIPAKFHKNRFDTSVINKLSELQWWNWPEDKIRRNIRLFNDPGNLLKDMS